ncbi:3384_t:CDS:1 [Scutellospora calospora]|uniref:3384_t:CDS:1 n=1 Tax=Scutellospora calospora TaxID=85575 RepID=A0ACA9KY93_9GLOM|nr:3384_t:CDS:1 [Scutellospora calospora]
MSPGQNINDNSSDPTTNSIMNSYKVNVGEQTFRLYRSSITFDAPNFFTPFLGEEANSGDAEANEIFITVSGSDGTGKDNDPPVIVETTKSKSSGHTQNYFTSDSEVTIDRDPKLFEVILRYLRGYNIFPLSSINLPPGMSLDLFRESLLEDARFYGLDRLAQLLQAETPTPLRYKDPFTSADKILLSLRDVPIHKDFIKSKLDGSSTIEFFTGAVLTIDLEPSDASIRFNTKFLNEQDQKALETLGEICGENTQIEFSRQLYANMKDALNGIRLEIDGVQVTGMDIASVGTNQRVKALEDMFRISGGQRLIIYAQEFVFRLDRIQPSTIDGNQIGTDNVCNSQNCTQDNNEKDNINGIIQSDANGVKVSVRDGEEDIEHNNEKTNKTVNAKEIDNPSHSEKSNVSKITNENSSNNNVNEGDMMYLGVVWAKGWTQEWWAWNEYRMKLDALQ